MYNSLIAASELADLLDRTSDLLIFDTNHDLSDPAAGRHQWEQDRIPGAGYLHLEDDLSGLIVAGKTGRHPLPKQADFLSAIKAKGYTGPNQQIIIYDAKGGGIAARGWWMFKWIGHENVAVLDGGFPAWKRYHDQVDKQPLTVNNSTASMRTKIALPIIIERSELQASDQLLIDSRTAPRYRGEQEPIDPVAGHIDGAINLPWPDNLDENGCFKAVEELKSRFALLRNETAQNVFYCGSGVTACHNILAYYHAFGEMPALYPGSWSEWIISL